MNRSILMVSKVASPSPFTPPPGVVIIHNGNGTAFEHNYMQQMSFVFNAGKRAAAAGQKNVRVRVL